MGANTRGVPARKPLDIRAEQASALIAEYGHNRWSCKVRKLGLQKVVDALAAQGGRGPLITRVLNDKKGKFRASIGESPIHKHVTKRCSCYLNGGNGQNGR